MSAKGSGDRADDDANEVATLGARPAPHIPKTMAGAEPGAGAGPGLMPNRAARRYPAAPSPATMPSWRARIAAIAVS